MGTLGSHALVTGGSRGIGPVIAAALAAEGVDVTLTARSGEGLSDSAARITHPVRVETIAVDLRDPAVRTALVTDAQERLGPIDILVNNAADDSYVAFRDQPLDRIEAEIETNLVAPLHLTSLLLDGMVERGRGHIVNLGSLAGKMGVPYKATYSATKAGLLEWATALRTELEGTGVAVSVVMPGVVSDVGVFSRQGIDPPKRAGSVTGDEVARGVVRAIRDRVPELIVTPTPMRPSLAIDALWPSFGGWVQRWSGVTAAMEELAARSRTTATGAGDRESADPPA